ncbi:unnamed protein product, partial [marine sediment metagenome]
MEATRSFFQGKQVAGNELPYIFEHTLAYAYGWELSAIRELDLYDFQLHLYMCLARLEIDHNFEL